MARWKPKIAGHDPTQLSLVKQAEKIGGEKYGAALAKGTKLPAFVLQNEFIYELKNVKYKKSTIAVVNEADPQGIRPTDLALASTLTKSGLTRAIDRLEALGLVGRRVCPTDGRGQLLVLTAKGRQKLRRSAPDFFRSVARHFADHLTERETETLAAAFGRIVAADRP